MEGHTIQGIVFAAQSPATRATVLRNTHMQTGECDAKDGEIIVLSSRLQLPHPRIVVLKVSCCRPCLSHSRFSDCHHSGAYLLPPPTMVTQQLFFAQRKNMATEHELFSNAFEPVV